MGTLIADTVYQQHAQALDIPAQPTQPVQLLTHSRSQCYRTCQRKHYLRYELGLVPIENAIALRMGSAFHRALELRDKTNATVDEICQVIRLNYSVIPEWVTDLEAWLVECEKVCALFRGHCWRWDSEPYEVVATEQKYEIPIRNPETGAATPIWRDAGKLDRIIKLSDGRLAVHEYKTCSESLDSDSPYWRRLRIDSQISRYMLAARTLDHDVRMVVYDVTRKPALRPKKLTKAERVTPDMPEKETPEMFGARCLRDMQERPEYYFARKEVVRLESELEEHSLELWQLQQQIRESQKNNRWFRNAGACTGFGTCEYLSICSENRNVTEETPTGFTRLDDVHPELKD